jgi:hypothetical protein
LSFSQTSSGYSGLTNAAVVGDKSKLEKVAGQANANIHDNTTGDLYNQSYFFKSDAIGIQSSSVEINNTPLAPNPLEPPQIFNKSLISLGNANIDM